MKRYPWGPRPRGAVPDSNYCHRLHQALSSCPVLVGVICRYLVLCARTSILDGKLVVAGTTSYSRFYSIQCLAHSRRSLSVCWEWVDFFVSLMSFFCTQRCWDDQIAEWPWIRKQGTFSSTTFQLSVVFFKHRLKLECCYPHCFICLRISFLN